MLIVVSQLTNPCQQTQSATHRFPGSPNHFNEICEVTNLGTKVVVSKITVTLRETKADGIKPKLY